MDPAQWRQRFMDRIKESLEVSNEEWMAIEPLVTAVSEKQRQAGMGRMGGMFGGDRRRGGDNQPQGPTEVQDLRDALEKKDTPAADLQAKLKALRDMRQKQETELKAAREELRKVLTARQEAQLVLFGMLD
jgi:hypothetical protein